ncbi:MAG: hypothetical protein WCJ70_02750 [bacterium]
MLQTISHFFLAIGAVIVTTFTSIQTSVSQRIFPPPPSWVLSPTPLTTPILHTSISPTLSTINYQLSITPSPVLEISNSKLGRSIPSLSPTVSLHTVLLPTPTIPWGTTEKIAEHTYRTYVGEDPVMSTEEEFVIALNKYRALHSVQELFVGSDLCTFATMRINQLKALGKLDAHAGFKEFLANDENWKTMPRFVALGENNSFGYKQSGTHLIEWIFDADEEHRSNQLNPQWNRTCVRISDTIVEVIFGQEK